MNMKKRVFSFLLAIVMAFMPMLFAGCESEESLGGGDFGGSAGGSGGSSTPGQSSFYKQFIDGFKVVYSKSQIGKETEVDFIANEFYANIFSNLDKFYGSGDGNGNLETFFPDSIRQTIYQGTNGRATLADGGIQNDKWLWTLNPNETSTIQNIQSLLKSNNDPIDYSKFVSNYKIYVSSVGYPQLSNENYYSIPLQIVLYETLLGYSQNGTDNRTMFEVEFVEGYEQYVPEIDITLEDAKYYKFAIKVKSSKNPILVDKYIYYYETAKYISYKKEGKTIVVVNESAKTLSCDQAISDYLETLKNSYKSTATYSGLTKTDADSLITYILNNVIGADVVKNDYVQFGPDQTTFVKDGNYYNYRNYVGRVAAMVYDFVYDGSEEFVYTYNQNGLDIKFDYIEYYKSVHGGELPSANLDDFQMRPQTAAFLRDYDTDMFFSNADAFDIFGDSNSEAHSFDNSPMSEYQSVVIMPKKEMTLSGIWMQIFSPNPDLAIKVYIRYYAYDPTTGTGKLFTWEQDEIDFYQSEPYDLAYANKDCKYHKYVEGKGYLYKTTEKDNNGNKIEGYYTDFEVGCSVEDVPEQFVELYDRNDPNALQLDAIKLDKFNNSSSDPKLQAEGLPVNGIVESQLSSAYAYKVIPSKNGFGGVTVLDERKVNFSFYEMVFDIEKDISFASQNYDYKLSVVTPV